MKRRILMFSVFVLTAALAAVPAFAQQSGSRTITEEQINTSYRVENPRRAPVSNMSVDLQPGQAVISATHTYRRGTVDTVTTMVPYIEGSRIYWEVTSIVTADGTEASPDLVAHVNASIASSWRNYIRGQVEGVVDSITVNEDTITIDYTFDGERAAEAEERLSDAVENGTVNEEDTPRLFRWFNRRGGN